MLLSLGSAECVNDCAVERWQDEERRMGNEKVQHITMRKEFLIGAYEERHSMHSTACIVPAG